jgi:hypothetical protein
MANGLPATSGRSIAFSAMSSIILVFPVPAPPMTLATCIAHTPKKMTVTLKPNENRDETHP